MTTTFQIEIDWNRDGTWVDETAWTLGIQVRCGFEQANDAVAAVGRCTVTLDNSTRRFSPHNSGGSLYGKLLPRRPVRVSATSGASTWVLFQGWIEHLKPSAGEWGTGECVLECVDGVALLARQKVTVTYEASKDVDAAVSALVGLAYTPAATNYDDNSDVISHYGRSWNPEETTVLDALRDVCQAVAGRFFVTRDGTATYWSRSTLQRAAGSAALTITDSSAIDALDVKLDVNHVVNQCLVTVYPVETVGASQVVWTAHSVLRIGPGQTRVLFANFHDSDGQRCGCVTVNALTPTTDYLVNDKADGSGFNYTTEPAFSISAVTEATRTQITLSNTATGPLYVTFLQVRGCPLRIYDPITLEKTDSTSQSVYEKRSLAFDLPLQADTMFGQSLANYLVGRYKDPALQADRLLVRNRDTISGVNLFSLDVMDKIAVSDSETGASSLGHWITRVEYDVSGSGFSVLLGLERSEERQFWVLGRAGKSELGRTTRIGF